MNKYRKIIFDTNVLLSAALNTKTPPARALEWAVSHAQLFASHSTLEELANVLNRSKFQTRLPEERRMAFLHAYAANITLVDVRDTVRECRDPKDDQFLALALSASADIIVAGDNDLLTMSPWRGIAILQPTIFLSQVSSM
jgi:putative PIN family toxin of toxin-antitoxin system